MDQTMEQQLAGLLSGRLTVSDCCEAVQAEYSAIQEDFCQWYDDMAGMWGEYV